MKATALIAEDEQLLAADLQAALSRLWPELIICTTVGDGAAAVAQALAHQPDILFMDIRMPGMTGIDTVQALVEDWPDVGAPFPLVVFVTAYDQYALQAFERAAFDYLLKPVQTARLAQTCTRLKAALQLRPKPAQADPALGAVIDQLRSLVAASAAAAPTGGTIPLLRVIQVASGSSITMVAVDEVLYFEALDKYVRVVTATTEHLVRISLRELMPQLDAQCFWQIHRGTVVRCDAIASAVRHESGKLTLTMKNRADKLTVSRLHAHLFRGM
ncbi:MAG: response regulator transcription factor [Herminiimonas sp.]|nr:response regulator transcription factor [Herminiimonas sp.]